nr:MAG TPA: hypothetical protein [Caudoviricetes sp.]
MGLVEIDGPRGKYTLHNDHPILIFERTPPWTTTLT